MNDPVLIVLLITDVTLFLMAVLLVYVLKK
jgi:hypothetical protein